MVLVGDNEECSNTEPTAVGKLFEKGAGIVNNIRTKYLGAADKFLTDFTNRTNNAFDMVSLTRKYIISICLIHLCV